MDVSSVTSATTAANGSTTSSTFASADFQTFLTMLTTQLQNQDPLNPMESTEFAVQLATFSGVEQQVRTNQLLEALVSGSSLSGISDYAAWIGKEARAAAPTRFDGSPIELSLAPAAGADTAVLVVSDEAGGVVAQLPVDAVEARVTWAGTDGQGQPVPNGIYDFTLQSYAGGKLVESKMVETYSLVTETRIEQDGTAILVLEGGGEVAASSVTALRSGS